MGYHRAQAMPCGKVVAGIIQVLAVVVITKADKVSVVNCGAEEYPGCAVIDLLLTNILDPDRKAVIRCGVAPG